MASPITSKLLELILKPLIRIISIKIKTYYRKKKGAAKAKEIRDAEEPDDVYDSFLE